MILKEKFLLILFFILLFLNCTRVNENNKNEPKLLINKKATLGEGAIWHHKKKKLYWIDIEKGELNIYSPAKDKNKTISLPAKIGTVVPASSGGVLLALETGIFKFNNNNKDSLKLIAHPEKNIKGNRYNDGKCGPAGRFWIGSMNIKGKKEQGALYRIDTNGKVKKILDKISVSNGIAWSPDHKTMYYTDTPTRNIFAYDFNPQSGTISNSRVVIKIPDSLGYPDGMTIDRKGKLWIAHWGGSAVCRWDPATGKLMRKIDIPAKNVTSCAFGGKDLKTLYITTARKGLNKQQLKKNPESGSVFAVKPGIKGIPAYFYKGNYLNNKN